MNRGIRSLFFVIVGIRRIMTPAKETVALEPVL